MDASGVALKGLSPDWLQPIVLCSILATCLLLVACASPDPTAVFGAVFGENSRTYGAAPGQELTASARLTGAAASSVERSQPASSTKHRSCEKPEKCIGRLKALISNPDRRWLKKPEEPATFANGVRLFAYMALQKKLSCDELTAALIETENAEKVFRGTVPGVRPMQVVAARRLSVRVARDLQAESAARCHSLSSAGR
jgi:hypothetical protein